MPTGGEETSRRPRLAATVYAGDLHQRLASSMRDTAIRLGRRHAAGRGSQVFTVDPKGSLAAVSRIDDASRIDGIENGMVPTAKSPHS